jgi:hypothetical protein
MTEIEKKTGITDAECEYWDDYYTENTFEPGPNLLKQGVKPGYAHDYIPLNELDHDVMEYLRRQSDALHKTRRQIINDLVREKLSVTV